MSKLVIIDSHALLHRAYHALPKDSLTQGGISVNAVYGFFSMLISAIDELDPDYLICCFDARGPTFRHKKFIGYQAHRPKMEDELCGQIDLTRETIEAASIPMKMVEGYEADDLAGTIAKKIQCSNVPMFKDNGQTIIVTGDKDLMQLVDDQTSLYLLGRGISGGELTGPEEVEEKLGVKPDQVVDYKALVGDSSDNYPGIYGIGPKTAAKLFKKYDTVDEIYDHLDEISDSIRKKLDKGKESAELSHELAEIVTDAPVEVDWDKAKFTDRKLIKLKKALENLNFRSLVQRIEDKFDSGKTESQMSLL
jgi:DNA polymerase I